MLVMAYLDKILENILILYSNVKIKNGWKNELMAELLNIGKRQFIAFLLNLLETKELTMMKT